MTSWYRRRSRGSQADPFIDLLFNTLLGFSFLFLISLVYINPKANPGKIDRQAEYIISASWPDNLRDDIDLWVRSPSGDTVSYLQKEAGWLNLDRDDRGELNDKITVDGREVLYPVNEEIVTIRNRQSGEYIVNLYYYKAESKQPMPIKIKVERINPRLETVFADTVNLNGEDDEQTVLRFTIRDDGSVHDINKLPQTLTPYRLDHMPSWAK